LERTAVAQSRSGVVRRSFEEREAVVYRHHVRQGSAAARKHEPPRRAVGEMPHAHAVFVERAQRRLLARERRGLVVPEPRREESAEIVARGGIEGYPPLI